MAWRKSEHTGNWKKVHYIAFWSTRFERDNGLATLLDAVVRRDNLARSKFSKTVNSTYIHTNHPYSVIFILLGFLNWFIPSLDREVIFRTYIVTHENPPLRIHLSEGRAAIQRINQLSSFKNEEKELKKLPCHLLWLRLLNFLEECNRFLLNLVRLLYNWKAPHLFTLYEKVHALRTQFLMEVRVTLQTLSLSSRSCAW
jgi:hypothetical protein